MSPRRASRRPGSRPGPGAGRGGAPCAKSRVSEPISRWLMTARASSYTNSIGSSSVTMCDRPVAVDVIDDRGERRGLAGSRGTRHQEQPLRAEGELLQHGRRAQVVQTGVPGRDEAEHGAGQPFLVERVAPDPAQPRATNEKSSSLSRDLRGPLLWIGDAGDQALDGSGPRAGLPGIGTRSPCSRIIGGRPAFRWRSLAPLSASVCKSADMVVDPSSMDAPLGFPSKCAPNPRRLQQWARSRLRHHTSFDRARRVVVQVSASARRRRCARDTAKGSPMAMKVIPTAAALGAEIGGVDLSQPLDDATFAAIERAYDEYGVIFFRGQSLTPRSRSRSRAGSARSNSTSSVSAGACRAVRRSSSSPTSPTTASRSASAAPARTGTATCATRRAAARDDALRARGPRAPRAPAGRHRFASAAAAWDALPEAMQQRLEGRRAVFDFRGASGPFRRRRRRSTAIPPVTPSDRADASVDRAQMPLRDARRLHGHRGDGAPTRRRR